MLLNRIFIGMFIIPFLYAFYCVFAKEDYLIFERMVNALFDATKNGFEIAIYLTGTLCFWLGIMKIGEAGGAIALLSKAVAPLFSKLFPDIPKDHPAVGSVMMNLSANMLGLDNAATPLGLKAMKEMQELNPVKDTASNAQIMFLVINTAGLTIIPVGVLSILVSQNALKPTEVFIPILCTTFLTLVIGIILVAIKQKINLFNKTILLYLGGLVAALLGLIFYVKGHPEQAAFISGFFGNLILISIIIAFITLAAVRKVNVYENFIDGAKEGFQTAINIIPYLVAMLAAISLLRSSGTLEGFQHIIKTGLMFLGVHANEVVDALPVAMMKTFSGMGARGLMVETFETFGVNSFTSKIAATFQGSTETTFYVLALYFGSVKIKHTKYAAGAGLVVDVIGAIIAIFMAYIFYPH